MLASNPTSSTLCDIKLHGAPRDLGLHLRGGFNDANELVRVVILEWNLNLTRDADEPCEIFHDRLCRMLAEASE